MENNQNVDRAHLILTLDDQIYKFVNANQNSNKSH